jgi:hypothetical protein
MINRITGNIYSLNLLKSNTTNSNLQGKLSTGAGSSVKYETGVSALSKDPSIGGNNMLCNMQYPCHTSLGLPGIHNSQIQGTLATGAGSSVKL